MATIQTCGRTASITGHYEDNYSYKTITIDSDNLDVSSPQVSYSMPEGTVYSATMNYTFKKNLAFSNDLWFLNITALGSLMTMYQTSGSYDLPPGKSFTEGEKLTITFNNKRNVPERVASIWETGKTNHMYHFVITIVYRTGTKVWVPQTTWTESCGFDKKSALSSAGSICTEPGGTRTITVDGKEYSQTNSCWAYSDSYVTGNPIVDYEQIMRLPNLNFYVRLPGEYPVVRLKLKYSALKKRQAGLIERNIRDALSPELERVIQENERAAAAAGLTFPTGEEVLEKGSEMSAAADGTAHVASAGTPASSPVEKKTATPETAPKPPQGTVPERKQVAVMEPVISGSATVVPEEGGGKHNTVTPPVIAEKKDNVVSLRSVGAMKKPTEAPGKLPVSPGVTGHPGTADSVQTMPDALKALRNRHHVPEPPVASPLSMLHRARQRPASSESDPQTEENGGESMNLDMKVTALPDGGLSVTTAGKPVTPKTPDEAHGTHRQLAQEEENILIHRHADDPGYDENDHYYYDREPEL